MAAQEWRRLRVLAAVLPLVVALSGCGPEEKQEESTSPALRYVALGDSFSAGAGVEPAEPASGQHPDCDQSGNAYPRLLDQSPVVDIELVGFLACAGATTENITTKPQFGSIEVGDSVYLTQFTQLVSLATLGDVDLVTLTIGGNDIKFEAFAKACAPPGDTLAACRQARDVSLDLVTRELPDRLKRTYEKIRSTVGPDTLVLVLGYPQMVPHGAYDPLTGPTMCTWLSQTGLDPVEVGYAQQITLALNESIKAEVNRAGPNFRYLDPEQDGPFDVARHGICTNDSYFNGLTLDFDGPVPNFYDSFHPNQRGQQAYADTVIKALLNHSPATKSPSSAAFAGELVHTLTGHSNLVWGVAWSPDGTRLATTSRDRTARVWNAAAGTAVHVLTGHSDAVAVGNPSWSPDGSRLATASWDGTARVWDAATGESVLTLTVTPDPQFIGAQDGHDPWMQPAIWLPDGAWLLVRSGYGPQIWNAATGALIRTFTQPPSAQQLAGVFRIELSPDGTRIATTTSPDGTTRVWNSATGELLLTLTDVSARGWSPDSARLITTTADGTVRVWDLAKGSVVFAQTHESTVDLAEWSPDGSQLATAGRDGVVRIWDAATWTLAHTLAGHVGGVRALAWSPDAAHLVTGGEDGTARVWDTRSGASTHILTGHQGPCIRPVLITSDQCTSAVVAVQWSPDGSRLATAGWDGTARIWR